MMLNNTNKNIDLFIFSCIFTENLKQNIMNKKIDFFKQNIIVSLIWNAPLLAIIIIPLVGIIRDLYLIVGIIVLAFVLSLNSLDKWYMKDRIDRLEKLIENKN